MGGPVFWSAPPSRPSRRWPGSPRSTAAPAGSASRGAFRSPAWSQPMSVSTQRFSSRRRASGDDASPVRIWRGNEAQSAMKQADQPSKIAFVSDYQPRRCGIATFTHDLRGAVAAQYPDAECGVLAINDVPEGYDYGPE